MNTGKFSAVRISSGLFILVVLAFGIYFGSRWFMADMSYNRVMATLDTWRDNSAVTSLAEWEQMREKTEKIITLHPENPENYRLLGLLYEWRGFAITGEEIVFDDILASRRQSANAYREAAYRRPAQPYGWAHLARMKTLAGERDDEFKQALQHAIALGRNNTSNLAEVAYITSISWGSISDDPQLHQQVKAVLIHGMQNTTSARDIFNYLDTAGLMPEFCPELDLETVENPVRGVCGG